MQAPIEQAVNHPALDQLKDIHISMSASIWPPAIGWWILLALIAVILVAGYFWLKKMYAKNQYKKLLLNELSELKVLWIREDAAVLQRSNIFLRRVAINHYPKKDVAQLSGNEWLGFLDMTMNKNAFSQGVGRVFGEAVYQPMDFENIDTDAIIKLIEEWLTIMSKKS